MRRDATVRKVTHMYFEKVKNLFFRFIIVECCTLNVYSQPYDSESLFIKYPGYGEDWMYIPDGDGNPHVAILKLEQVVDEARIFVNIEESVSFILYTRKNPQGEELTMEEGVLERSNFNFDKGTKFLTHGWMSSGNSSTCQQIKNAYLENVDDNVVIMDWSPVADNAIYVFPALNTEAVGSQLAKFLDFLICRGYDSKKIHVIGHSLGAHVAGIAGTKNNGRLGRVTGLDPANPIFNFGLLQTLTNQSAQFVDVIHTSSGIIGMGNSLGHADFYPNGGGPPQPGCFGLTEFVEGCSHASSWKYYLKTIQNSEEYASFKCSTYQEFERGKCVGNDPVYMGEGALQSARGSYYLKTQTV